jgi:hypothetical protein
MSDATCWEGLMGPWIGSRAENGDIAPPAIAAIKAAGRTKRLVWGGPREAGRQRGRELDPFDIRDSDRMSIFPYLVRR